MKAQINVYNNDLLSISKLEDEISSADESSKGIYLTISMCLSNM